MGVNWLFVDMNSYFASVEQQDRPDLRGLPVAVAPVMAESSSCIAASYEAKAYGVRTGTPLWQARQLCPDIRIVPARVPRYVEVHHDMVKAVDAVLPVDQVHSIDELSCRLTAQQKSPPEALRLAAEVKASIAGRVGRFLRCSVGLAPNRFLAKVATDLHKPDGLTMLEPEALPGPLLGLTLRDFPGIGSRVEVRFHRAGIFTTPQMYAASEAQLERIWGSIVGRRWYWQIRGQDINEPPTQRRTVGQSHVLPPELRSDEGAYGVLVKLITKAARRLRLINYWGASLSVRVQALGSGRWEHTLRFPPSQETSTFLEIFNLLWQHRSRDITDRPLKVAMTLSNLTSDAATPRSMLASDLKRRQACRAMDEINDRFGRDKLYPAAMHATHAAAPARIAFTRIPDAHEFDLMEDPLFSPP